MRACSIDAARLQRCGAPEAWPRPRGRNHNHGARRPPPPPGRRSWRTRGAWARGWAGRSTPGCWRPAWATWLCEWVGGACRAHPPPRSRRAAPPAPRRGTAGQLGRCHITRPAALPPAPPPHHTHTHTHALAHMPQLRSHAAGRAGGGHAGRGGWRLGRRRPHCGAGPGQARGGGRGQGLRGPYCFRGRQPQPAPGAAGDLGLWCGGSGMADAAAAAAAAATKRRIKKAEQFEKK